MWEPFTPGKPEPGPEPALDLSNNVNFAVQPDGTIMAIDGSRDPGVIPNVQHDATIMATDSTGDPSVIPEVNTWEAAQRILDDLNVDLRPRLPGSGGFVYSIRDFVDQTEYTKINLYFESLHGKLEPGNSVLCYIDKFTGRARWSKQRGKPPFLPIYIYTRFLVDKTGSMRVTTVHKGDYGVQNLIRNLYIRDKDLAGGTGRIYWFNDVMTHKAGYQAIKLMFETLV